MERASLAPSLRAKEMWQFRIFANYIFHTKKIVDKSIRLAWDLFRILCRPLVAVMSFRLRASLPASTLYAEARTAVCVYGAAV